MGILYHGNENEWGRLVYNRTCKETELIKRRQWSLTYYIIIIFAGIIGLASLRHDLCYYQPSEVTIFIGLLIILLFVFGNFGVYHLLDMQRVITDCRNKIWCLSKYKFNVIQKVEAPRGENEATSFNKYFWDFTLWLIFIIDAGLFFCGFYLFGIYNRNTDSDSDNKIKLIIIVFACVPILIQFVFYLIARYRSREERKRLIGLYNPNGVKKMTQINTSRSSSEQLQERKLRFINKNDSVISIFFTLITTAATVFIAIFMFQANSISNNLKGISESTYKFNKKALLAEFRPYLSIRLRPGKRDHLQRDLSNGKWFVDSFYKDTFLILPVYWKNDGKIPAMNIEASYSGPDQDYHIVSVMDSSDVDPGGQSIRLHRPHINVSNSKNKDSFKTIIKVNYQGNFEIDSRTYYSHLHLTFKKKDERFYLEKYEEKTGIVDGGKS